jgi:cell division cycle 2-like protein
MAVVGPLPAVVDSRSKSCNGKPIWSLDDYGETGVLGYGSFGTVIKARYYGTGESVAIRILTSTSSQDAALREAGLLAACGGHRSIVQLRAMSFDPATDALSLVRWSTSGLLKYWAHF